MILDHSTQMMLVGLMTLKTLGPVIHSLSKMSKNGKQGVLQWLHYSLQAKYDFPLISFIGYNFSVFLLNPFFTDKVIISANVETVR